MEEQPDEGGGSRVSSRPTVKKDGLDDPALDDAGPDLDSPGETVNLGPNHPEAVAEESRPHGVDQNPNDGAAAMSGNPDDVAPQSGLNFGDTGTEAVSIVSDGVAPMDGNPGGVTAEVVQSPRNVALGRILNPNYVAQAGVVGISASNVTGAVGNFGDTGPAAMPNRDDVAPAVGNSGNAALGTAKNSDDDALGVVQNLNSVALGTDVLNSNDVAREVVGKLHDLASEAVANPNNDASDAVSRPSDVAPGVVENLRNVAPGSILNPVDGGQVLAPNPDNVAPVAGNLGDNTRGGDTEPADGAVQNPDMVKELEITVEMEPNGASRADHQDGDENSRNSASTTIVNADSEEMLWSRAVAQQACDKLTELLAKDVTYFWKFEKKNEVGTTLHAAASSGNAELAERVLKLLSWAQETDNLDMRFSDTTLDIDGYVELERDGKTAAAVAQENNHVAIQSNIRDYIADRDQQHIYDTKRSTASLGVFSNRNSREILRWNDAIKKMDCLALVQILPKSTTVSDVSSVELELIKDLVKVELKNGKGGRRTALHIAAMQGCLQLATVVLHLFRETVRSKRDDIVDYILARDEESGLTAYEMANDVIGNRSISEYIKSIYYTYARFDNFMRMLRLNVEEDLHRLEEFPKLYSFDAYPGTRWYRALENGNTRELKKLLEGNSRFILETYHGMTVLHVAILWDDLELVKVVLNLFCNERNYGKAYIHWGSSYYPEELSLDDMIKKGRIINRVYLNEYWKDASSGWQPLSKRMFKHFKNMSYSIRSLAKILERKEILDELKKANRHVTISSTPTPRMELLTTNTKFSTMPSRMSAFFIRNWPLEYDGEFEEDVDFKFEDLSRKDWLRVHYACKDPLKFNNFLQQMALYIMQHPYDASMLLQTWDGKGRTPFHILMDHYNDEKDPGWPFHEIFNHECFKEWIQIVENPRGKKIIDIVLSKNYLQRNVILHPWTYFKVNLNYEKFEKVVVTTFLYYQFAYLLRQKDMDEEIWSRFLDKVLRKDLTNMMEENQDTFNSMLLLVASTGNYTCLQLLLEINQDPMISDSYGRSLLHHAADPTILLSELLGHCCLTIEDVCNVRRKFMSSNTIPDSQPSSSSNCDANHNGSNIVRQSSSNSTNEYNTTNTNDTHAQKPRTLDTSSGERSNVGRKACILMLLQGGVDLGQPDKDNKVPTIGPNIDATYQSWWHDMVVKDSTDKKQAFSQAGNALSVVGTLVAATSYVGPLQPPLSFDTSVGTGFVKTTEPLIKVFMVSNSVAFYLAMASVMFAVVSSLPMPQEGVISELTRAKHVIALSLCLLQIAIGSIIISFATASIVAIQNEHLFRSSNLLFSPSIIGWFFCLLGIGGFLIRLARLIFYRSRVVRAIYQFSFSKNIKRMIVGPLRKLIRISILCLSILLIYPLGKFLVCLGFHC